MRNSKEKENIEGQKDLVNSFGSQREVIHKEADGKKEKVIVRFFDKMVGISIFMIFFGIPLFFTSFSFQGMSFEKQIYFYFWLFLGLVAWASKGVIVGEINIKRTPLDIPILSFWVVYLLATIFSVDKWHSFLGYFGDPSRGFISITALIIAYYLFFSYLDFKRLKVVMIGVVASGFIMSVWSFLVIENVQFIIAKFPNFFPLSLVGSVTGLGIYFSLIIPIVILAIFLVTGKKYSKSYVKVSILSLLVLNLILNLFIVLSLSGFITWAVLFFGIVFFAMFLLAQIVKPSGNLTWIIMVVCCLILTFWIVGKNNIARVTLPVEVSPNFELSYDIAKNSLSENPILGSGPATYGYDFSLFKSESFNLNRLYEIKFYQGGGMIFEYISTIGILGVIALMILVLSFVSMGLYLLTKNKEKNKIYSLGFFTAALIFLINAIFIRIEGSILIFGSLICILALMFMLYESDSDYNSLKVSLKASPKFALTLAFIFMIICVGVTFSFIFIGRLYVADIYAGLAAREDKVSEEGSINKLLKAVTIYGEEGRYFSRIGQEYMLLANQEILKDKNSANVQYYINEAIRFSVEGRNLLKNDVFAVESLAKIYENTGIFVPDSLKLAEESYLRALELDPKNPKFYLKLGQLKRSLANSEKNEGAKKQLMVEAKDYFQNSVDKKDNFDIGHYNLAFSKANLEDYDGAIESMGKAIGVFRNMNQNRIDPNYLIGLSQLYQLRNGEGDMKIAEDIFKGILEIDQNQMDARINLGFLYEKQGKKDDAINQFNEVLKSIPDESIEAKDRINKIIENIRNGVENNSESINVEDTVEPESINVEDTVDAEITNAETEGDKTLEIPEDLEEIPNLTPALLEEEK